ncbi:MAG: galactosyltransferase-related protein [Bacteroidales bacterium]|nr:galactosyltransferase-related protein [Bacteroidales bacterium]
MKVDLKDITFLILVRLDSVQRLENTLTVTEALLKYFDTNVTVVEASGYNNQVLKRLLNRKINYLFKEDKDPVLYKTRRFNAMTPNVATPYIAIWDTDVVVDKKAVLEAVTMLRNQTADVAWPYNGTCYNTSEILRTLFMKRKDIRVLYRHMDKMELLHHRSLVGGAVLVNREKYIYAGMENEKHYGWGDDDFDRCYRFERLGFKTHWVDTCLFHLSHPRAMNSSFASSAQKRISSYERFKTESSSKQEIQIKFLSSRS